MKKHVTFGPLASIEGHTPDGERYVIEAAKVTAGPDGIVYRCEMYRNTPALVTNDAGKLDLVYPGKTSVFKDPPKSVRNALDAPFTALHEGRRPGQYFLDQPRTGRSLAKDALVIDAVSYVKATTESASHIYRHEIELSENSKPTLAISQNQELWFRNQASVTVTERGIEDMTSKAIARVNPFTQDNLKRAAMSSFLAGGTGLGWVLGVNYLVEQLPVPAKTFMTGYTGAAVKAAVGILAAVAIDGQLDEKSPYRPVAAGIGVGGVIGGGMQAFDTYKATDSTQIPTSFASAAAYDDFVRAHPTLTVPTTLRPPAGVGNRPPFGQTYSGARRAA